MQNIAVSWDIMFNEDTLKNKKEETKLITFHHDPLAFTIKMDSDGMSLGEIHTALLLANTTEVEQCFIDEASKIRSFFNHSILLRRLKNEFISSFMEIVEALNNNVYVVDESHLKALVKLPDFFKESTETNMLFAEHVSLSINQPSGDLSDTWNFVKKIKRSSKHENQYRYYFTNDKKQLLSFFVNVSDRSFPVWNYIASSGPVGIKGYAYPNKQPGHDFIFYKMSNYEFYPVR